MTGMVLAEILQGIKSQKEAGLVRDHLQKLPYLETTRNIWESAGEISASLRIRRITIPLSDLIIAAIAMAHHCEVFTVDPHFVSGEGTETALCGITGTVTAQGTSLLTMH